MTKKFLRRIWSRHSKLGKGRKKKQVWRKPKGRDNKMREKRKGRPPVVSIGFRNDRKTRNKIEGKNMVTIYNMNDLENVGKEDIVIIGKVGGKKRLEIIKKIKEKKINVHNINLDKMIKRSEKK